MSPSTCSFINTLELIVCSVYQAFKKCVGFDTFLINAKVNSFESTEVGI